MLFADLAGLHAVHGGARAGGRARDARHLLRRARADDRRATSTARCRTSSATRSSPSSTSAATSPTTRCRPRGPRSSCSAARRRSAGASRLAAASASASNTGPVLAGVVGDRGHRIHGVFGDTVNLGSRLEGQAPPGEVVIGGATLDHLPERRRSSHSRPCRSRARPTPVQAFIPPRALAVSRSLWRLRASTSSSLFIFDRPGMSASRASSSSSAFVLFALRRPPSPRGRRAPPSHCARPVGRTGPSRP